MIPSPSELIFSSYNLANLKEIFIAHTCPKSYDQALR
jgi:hypothetical protein